MDDIERNMRAALASHGIDPDDPEIQAEVRAVLGVMGSKTKTPHCPLCDMRPRMTITNISLCGNLDCTVLYWDNTMDLDELMLSSQLVSLDPIEKRKAIDDDSTS
jgi:hypothetical protein